MRTTAKTNESTITPNRYPGNCSLCGTRVLAGLPNRSPIQGQAFKVAGGRWQVRHVACVEDWSEVVTPAAVSVEVSHIDGGPLMPSYNEIKAARKSRPSWAEVLEANEWFDGEPEITAAAKAAWLDGRYDR